MAQNEQVKILVIDDVKSNLVTLRGMIQSLGYTPYLAQSISAARTILEKQLPKLILLDISMPEMSGLEFFAMLKENPQTRRIPVIFISASEDEVEREQGFELGAVDYIQKPFAIQDVAIRIKAHLRLADKMDELENRNRRLNLMTRQLAEDLWKEQENLIFALGRLIEGRDEGTVNHIDNLSYNSWVLAQALQLTYDFENEISDNFIKTIKTAVVLHDIGKLAIGDTILLKQASLTEQERLIMQKHTTEGQKILQDIYNSVKRNDFMKMAIDVAYCHHEHWDGSGYPQGLKGEEIPLSARILAVMDVYDALVNERVYKEAYGPEQSMEMIRAGAGTEFDPRIVDVMCKIKRHLKA